MKKVYLFFSEVEVSAGSKLLIQISMNFVYSALFDFFFSHGSVAISVDNIV